MNKEPELEDFKREWNACLDAAEPLLEPSEEVLDGLFYEAVRRRRMRVVRRRRAWSIAASVALVMGVGMALLWPENEMSEGVLVAERPIQPCSGGVLPASSCSRHESRHPQAHPAAPLALMGKEAGRTPPLQEEAVSSVEEPPIPLETTRYQIVDPYSSAPSIYFAEMDEPLPRSHDQRECSIDCEELAEIMSNCYNVLI